MSDGGGGTQRLNNGGDHNHLADDGGGGGAAPSPSKCPNDVMSASMSAAVDLEDPSGGRKRSAGGGYSKRSKFTRPYLHLILLGSRGL